ncbi:MAG TPA: hypothetical protein VGG02_03935 [Chthoniobacterales bacterium]|jgi:hypothetical protein
MARNDFPSTNMGKIRIARQMAFGIVKVGASVPITLTTEDELETCCAALQAAESAVGVARVAKMEAYADSKPAAAAVAEFLTTARPIFASNFGNRWSASWAPVGWAGPSTMIPKTKDARLGLLDAMVNFLVKNPNYEVANSGVTALDGAAVYNYAVLTEEDVVEAIQGLQAVQEVRAAARAALLQVMRAVVKNLAAKLAPNDPRWLSFGLNEPATKLTPAKPTGLAAAFSEATGSAVLTCDAQPNVERWRFRGRIAGPGGPFDLMARSTEPLARTDRLQPGRTFEFTAQAVNGGSQSVPSESIFFTVPGVGAVWAQLPAAAGAGPVALEPRARGTEAAKPNGNGDGNNASQRRGAPPDE